MPIRIISEQGNENLARVFVAELPDGARIEFVESVQPPVPREKKWVLIVSTLKGCPIECPICDAGGDYRGKLTVEEILAQIDHLIARRYGDGPCGTERLKIQFARMGDPALNENVLTVLERLPVHLPEITVMPSISTVAPAGRDRFFEELLRIKHTHYGGGRFQMQFSIHTTDAAARRRLIPAKTWSLGEIAAYGARFYEPGDRKITLNFAPPTGEPLDPAVLAAHFSPATFLIKLTPINPTKAARHSGLTGLIDPERPEVCHSVVAAFRAAGFDTLLSIGEQEENRIGSNCGMYVADSAKAR